MPVSLLGPSAIESARRCDVLAGQQKKPEGLRKHKGTVDPAHEATQANRKDRMNRLGLCTVIWCSGDVSFCPSLVSIDRIHREPRIVIGA